MWPYFKDKKISLLELIIYNVKYDDYIETKYCKTYLKFAVTSRRILRTVRVIGCNVAVSSTKGNSKAQRFTVSPIFA